MGTHIKNFPAITRTEKNGGLFEMAKKEMSDIAHNQVRVQSVHVPPITSDLFRTNYDTIRWSFCNGKSLVKKL